MPDHTTNLSVQAATEWVGVDWGSSNLTILTFGSENDGANTYAEGIADLPRSEIPTCLKQHLKELGIAFNTPILMCGMVGARGGWLEAPYLDAPLRLRELSEYLIPVADDDLTLFLVPGVRIATGQVDVMRGEEVQARGWLEASQHQGEATMCLPGTHSKWLTLVDDRVTGLETALTGELFALLCQHSLLVSGGQTWDQQAFNAGVERSRSGSGLIHSLFSTRARVVAADYPAETASSYLSGLLIGSELMERGPGNKPADPLHLVGASPLLDYYANAANRLNIETLRWDGEEMVRLGLKAIWSER